MFNLGWRGRSATLNILYLDTLVLAIVVNPLVHGMPNYSIVFKAYEKKKLLNEKHPASKAEYKDS